MSVVRILVADDHKVVRAGLVSMLEQEPDFDVVATACDGDEVQALWGTHRPDITLMDLGMPRTDGIEAIRRIRESDPLAAILVLSTYDGDEDIYRALRAGARGYLLKDTEPTVLFDAIRTVSAGKTFIPAPIAEKLAERLNAESLTERELEILQWVVRGQSNKMIANRLEISEGTVKTHLKSILEKLDATSRTEAAAIAQRRGLAHL